MDEAIPPTRPPDRSTIGRNSKSRAKGYERDVARILGGKRHLADTGGPEDVEHPTLAVQVKSGLSVVTQVMRDGLESARKAAEGTDKLPVVALIDRKGSRLQRWVAIPMEEFAAWMEGRNG